MADTFNGGNFDYAAMAAAVAAAVPPVQAVRLVPMHVLRDQAISVGTGAVIQVHPVSGQQTISLQADPENTGTVYVGTSATVGAGDWPLGAGGTLALDSDASLFVIASAGNQILHIIAGGG